MRLDGVRERKDLHGEVRFECRGRNEGERYKSPMTQLRRMKDLTVNKTKRNRTVKIGCFQFSA